MIRVIDGTRYNTTTAVRAEFWSNHLPMSDFKWCEETLYRTRKGSWFLFGEGGPMTEYAREIENEYGGYGYGSEIVPLSPTDVVEWLGRRGLEASSGLADELVLETLAHTTD